MIHGAGVMGLADGPTEVHKVTVARQVLRDYQASDDLWPTAAPAQAAGGGPGEVRRVPRARGGEPVIDARRGLDRRGWTSERPAPATGRARSSTRFISGGIAERDLRDPPRRPARRPAHPAADGARRAATTGILREWRIIEALDGTDVPHTAAIAVCTDPSVLGRTFYLMGFVDGWSPMGHATAVAGAVRHRPRGPPGPRVPAGRGHRPARRKVDWQAKGLAGPRPARRLPRAPGRPLDRVPRAHQGPRAARASTRRPRGCARTGRSTTSPASCTATTSSPT